MHNNTVIGFSCSFRPFTWPGRLQAGFVPLLLAFLLLTGCESGPPIYPVEPDAAKQSLELVLNGWKEGKPIDTWMNATPKIVVQDHEWSMGRKLISFEIGKGEPIDANLHNEVTLTLDIEGKPTPKKVTYLVGTKPVITVFRKLGP